MRFGVMIQDPKVTWIIYFQGAEIETGERERRAGSEHE
jgi:hypothetical protein